MAPRRITAQEIDELRMPPSVFGGDPRGAVDPAALLAASWGTPYDVDARRAAITKALLDQQLAAAAPAPTPRDAAGMGTTPNYRFQDSTVGTGRGDTAAETGRTPGAVTQQNFFSTAIPPDFDRGKPTPFAQPQPDDEDTDKSGKNALTDDEADAITAAANQSLADMTMAANAISQSSPTAPPGGYPGEHSDIPGATPSTTTTAQNAPTAPSSPSERSGIPSGDRSPSMQGDQIPGSTPPSGNLFEGPGFIAPQGSLPASRSDPVAPTAPATTSTTVPSSQMPGNVIPGAAVPGFVAPGKNQSQVPSEVPQDAPITPTSVPTTTFVAPTAPGKGKGDTISDEDADAALADLDASMQAMNAVAQAMPGAPPAAPSDYDFTSPNTGPFEPGGGYSPGAALTAGTQAATAPTGGSGYGGKSGFAGAGLADMANAMANAPGAPGGRDFGGFDAGGPGRGMTEGAMAAAADAAGVVSLGDLSDPGAAATQGLTDVGSFSPSAADVALSAPGGIDMSGSATGGKGGPGMGMSEGAMAAAAQAAADAVSETGEVGDIGDVSLGDLQGGEGDTTGNDGNGNGGDE